MNAFNRRTHISWLLAIAAVAMLIGVWFSRYYGGSTPLLLFAAISLIALLSVQKVWVIPPLIVTAFIIGLSRGSGVMDTRQSVVPIIGSRVMISGTVSDDMDSDKRGNGVLRLKNIAIEGQRIDANAWVVLDKKYPIERSDQVSVYGKASEGFGSFSLSMYQATVTKFERPVPGDRMLHVRNWFAALVEKAVLAPESALGLGYLVGQRRDLPQELDDTLKIAGLTHIVVASGYNLTILVRLARRLFARISRYQAVLASSCLIVGFIAVTGMSPSMSRAGLVAGLSLAAWYYGRNIHPFVLLTVAAATTGMINPSYLWGDIGWQLSFAAFAGVMIVAPLLQSYYFGEKKPGIARQILGETVAATLVTAPILIYNFGYISNVAIPANLLILPLVPLAMLLAFIAGLGALLAPGIAELIGIPAWSLLHYMIEVAHFFASLSWAKSEFSVTPLQVVGAYGVMMTAVIYLWRKTKLDLRKVNLVE